MNNKERQIPIINETVKYWIVRSGIEGKYFNEFFYDNFIALGWDKIDNINQIKEFKSADLLKPVVRKKYYDDLQKTVKPKSINRKIGDISNKIYKFINELKVDDIVITPGKNEILIGKVTSEVFLVADKYNNISFDLNDTIIGQLNKVRKVQWINRIKKDELEPNLKLVLGISHGISHINHPQVITEINRSIYNYYISNDTAHTIYRIKSQEDVDFSKYANFIYHMYGIYQLIKDDFEDNSLTIKTNVQSPGPIEFIGNNKLMKQLLAGASMFFKNKTNTELNPKYAEKINDYKVQNPNNFDYTDYEFPGGMGTY